MQSNRKTHKSGILFFSIILLLLLCCACGRKEGIPDFSIVIDLPSDQNIPMPVGRSFYVSGSVSSEGGLPEGAVIEVDLLDGTGAVIRHAYGTEAGSDKYYIYPEMTEKFCTDNGQVTDIMRSTGQCEYLVSDPSDPDRSFRNAEIKCILKGDTFKAMIVAGTDEEHGAAVDDGCHFTDADGKPLTAFPEGDYTVRITLKDKNGKSLASAEKPLTVRDPEVALAMRFHPDAYLDLILGQMENIAPGYKTNIDYIPGFMAGIDKNAGGRTMLFKANDLALYRRAHTFFQIYAIDPHSSSWTVEMPYLYSLDYVDDPAHLTFCYYDIGEPVLSTDSGSLQGNIRCFDEGDHHAVCRIDLVEKGSAENEFDVRGVVSETFPTPSDTTVQFRSDRDLAVMGVLAPAKLKDCYVFDPYTDELAVTNRVERLIYRFSDGETVMTFEKPVYLSRKNVEETEGYYDSVLEYYHIFDSDCFEPGKLYRVSVCGTDKNGEEVEGTAERFSVMCIEADELRT